MTYTNFGLPRYVIAILHIMEAHKDCLKWTVSERSHKLSLTLTWDFKYREGKNKKTFWEKLQNTLKGNSGNGGSSKSSSGASGKSSNEESSDIPRNLIRFIKHLEMETKEEEKGLQIARQSLQRSSQLRNNSQQAMMLRRQQHWSRYSLQSLPMRLQSSSQTQLSKLADAGQAGTHPGLNHQRLQQQRYNAMKSFASYHHLPSRDTTSPFHSSWPDGSFEASSDQVDDGCTPTENVIASGGPPNQPGHVTGIIPNNPGWSSGRLKPANLEQVEGIAGRMQPETSSVSCRGDELDDDSEVNDSSLTAGPPVGRRSASRHSGQIQQKVNGSMGRKPLHVTRTSSEHRRSISAGGNNGSRNPAAIRRRDPCSSQMGLNDAFIKQKGTKAILPANSKSSAAITSESDSASEVQSDDDEPNQRKHTVNQTVIRCLDSCDKILFRHSTTIT